MGVTEIEIRTPGVVGRQGALSGTGLLQNFVLSSNSCCFWHRIQQTQEIFLTLSLAALLCSVTTTHDVFFRCYSVTTKSRSASR